MVDLQLSIHYLNPEKDLFAEYRGNPDIALADASKFTKIIRRRELKMV